jgi:dTMP kinase
MHPSDAGTEAPPTHTSAAGRGAHIAFTGIDGSGKSTQAALLRRRLEAEGYCTYLMESKEDFVGNTMRAIAARRGLALRDYFGHEQTDLARAFDTLRHQAQMIVPLIESGSIVVQPRSGYCRAGAAAAYGSRNLEQVEEVIFFAGEPHLTVWIDVPTPQALDRIDARGTEPEDPEVLERFRRSLAAFSSRRSWIHIDGARPVREVQAGVWDAVSAWLESSGRTLLRAPTP